MRMGNASDCQRIVGYTQGVFDMFHIGHLNLLNKAKEHCDYLIVGVNSDDLVWDYKHKRPIVSQEARKEIVSNIKAVDECIIVHTLDKLKILEIVHFDIIFIGDDWKGNARWENTERLLSERGIRLQYLPYTHGVSSSILRDIEGNRVLE